MAHVSWIWKGYSSMKSAFAWAQLVSSLSGTSIEGAPGQVEPDDGEWQLLTWSQVKQEEVTWDNMSQRGGPSWQLQCLYSTNLLCRNLAQKPSGNLWVLSDWKCCSLPLKINRNHLESGSPQIKSFTAPHKALRRISFWHLPGGCRKFSLQVLVRFYQLSWKSTSIGLFPVKIMKHIQNHKEHAELIHYDSLQFTRSWGQEAKATQKSSERMSKMDLPYAEIVICILNHPGCWPHRAMPHIEATSDCKSRLHHTS